MTSMSVSSEAVQIVYLYVQAEELLQVDSLVDLLLVGHAAAEESRSPHVPLSTCRLTQFQFCLLGPH